MNNFLLVFIGGGLGSLARYAGGLIFRNNFRVIYPWGTFTINVLACFILGLLTAYLSARTESPALRLLIGVGFCGGFSTFSTFTAETMDLISKGNISAALLYISGSVLLCMLAFAGGLAVRVNSWM